ncbi:hypothetical protein [Candidatus Caldatribacterium sp.]|uniref:hypothetical protein n=1 Tax=Candidatus Caldatribacterium sp. TaxID=2282143 RepID=UPI00383CFA4E|nr:DivIVA domain-containing protein [Candidatus Caldatribacterium sp.]
MTSYDPFRQGYLHDWRLEEAVREGVRRALAAGPRPTEGAPPVTVVRREGYSKEEVERIIDIVKREIVAALHDRILTLTKENRVLRERVRELENELRKYTNKES